MHVYALLFDCRLVHLGVNLQLAKGSLQRSLRKLKGHPPRKPMGPEAPTPTSTRAHIYKGQPKHKRHSTRARTLIAQQRKPVSRQMKRRQRKAQRGTRSAVLGRRQQEARGTNYGKWVSRQMKRRQPYIAVQSVKPKLASSKLLERRNPSRDQNENKSSRKSTWQTLESRRKVNNKSPGNPNPGEMRSGNPSAKSSADKTLKTLLFQR